MGKDVIFSWIFVFAAKELWLLFIFCVREVGVFNMREEAYSESKCLKSHSLNNRFSLLNSSKFNVIVKY